MERMRDSDSILFILADNEEKNKSLFLSLYILLKRRYNNGILKSEDKKYAHGISKTANRR